MKKILTTFCLAILSCNGCVYAPMPEIPELKLPEVNTKVKEPLSFEPKALVQAENCPEQEKTSYAQFIAMPESVPKNLKLVIVNGKVDKEKSDKNGIALVRRYVGVREAIKKQWDDALLK